MLQDSDTWLNVLQEGLGLARAGEFDAALVHFERARKLAPTRAETACALGREHMRRGKADKACKLLRGAWDQDPSLVTAGTSLARCLGLDLAQFSEAHQVLDQVDAHHPNDNISRLIRSEVLLAEGRHEEASLIAEKLQDSAQERVAKSATLLLSRVENERGLCAASNSGFDRAIFAFRRASNLDPRWAAPQSNLGAAFEKIGKPQRAEAAYRQALKLDSTHARAWHNLAKLYDTQNDLRAASSMQRAFYSDPASASIALDYALALAARAEQSQAEKVLAEHAQAIGDSSDAWASMILPLSKLGASAQAQYCLRGAQERSSDPDLIARAQALLDATEPGPKSE